MSTIEPAMRAELRDRLRLGRSGPASRTVARAITRVAPVRGIDWIAYAVIGKPRDRKQTVVANRYGANFELELSDDVDRLLFLDTYERLALRDTLSLVGPGDLVVDVGANIGLYSLAAAALGARVESFEPVPSTADRFERNLSLNPSLEQLVTFRRVGLSDREGSLTLHSESFGEFSGHASAHLAPGEQTESTSVPTTTLDAALAETDQPIRLMKIDVEGHEAAVLRGARETFARLGPDYLFVEIEHEHLVRAGSSGDELLDAARGLGYRELGGYTLHHGLWPRTEPEVVSSPFPTGVGQSVLMRRVEGSAMKTA